MMFTGIKVPPNPNPRMMHRQQTEKRIGAFLIPQPPLLQPSDGRSDEASNDELEPRKKETYFETSVLTNVCRRFPWLVSLMLVQSISGWIVERFEKLIERHIILAAFLTMLVGGGGNSSGQTVATLVRSLGAGEITGQDFCRVLRRELAIGIVLACSLGLCAYPRVRFLSHDATNLDGITIAISYAAIVLMANAIAVLTVLTLHQCDMAAVGSPPVVQVLVDVLGIMVTMLVASAILGPGDEVDEAERR